LTQRGAKSGRLVGASALGSGQDRPRSAAPPIKPTLSHRGRGAPTPVRAVGHHPRPQKSASEPSRWRTAMGLRVLRRATGDRAGRTALGRDARRCRPGRLDPRADPTRCSSAFALGEPTLAWCSWPRRGSVLGTPPSLALPWCNANLWWPCSPGCPCRSSRRPRRSGDPDRSDVSHPRAPLGGASGTPAGLPATSAESAPARCRHRGAAPPRRSSLATGPALLAAGAGDARARHPRPKAHPHIGPQRRTEDRSRRAPGSVSDLWRNEHDHDRTATGPRGTGAGGPQDRDTLSCRHLSVTEAGVTQLVAGLAVVVALDVAGCVRS
jgi:hypothetical protein